MSLVKHYRTTNALTHRLTQNRDSPESSYIVGQTL